jgi:hypothetical protein
MLNCQFWREKRGSYRDTSHDWLNGALCRSGLFLLPAGSRVYPFRHGGSRTLDLCFLHSVGRCSLFHFVCVEIHLTKLKTVSLKTLESVRVSMMSIPSWYTFLRVQKISPKSIPEFAKMGGWPDQSIPQGILFQRIRLRLCA